ncbi:sensor histidine kinase [Streptomyces flavofungini]|uniref:histidine kinase n=1 Tax=Streptomyces flavofungini TaxID=68200 RepID=A0ABS0X9Z9_9ACTN|nr:sensor histidine kinase [Streptomyces flavofungini]MBJ3810008.1 sensor domain-containing protein [Streptomyces flavofungini]GHC53473.1 histidine kinase [Streptomyces flavofungini]
MHDSPRATPHPTPDAPPALVATVLRAPFTRRAWTEAAYCLIAFPPALAGGVVLLVFLALGAGLTVSLLGAVIGALVLVGCLWFARRLGALHRGLASGLLGERVPGAGAPGPGSGVFGRLDARLRDAAGWRAVWYALVKLPVGALGWYAVLFWVTGLINVTAPLRWGVFGQNAAPGDGEGMPVVTPVPVGGFEVHTFAGTFVALPLGLALLLLAPWATRLAVEADRRLLRALLGPNLLAARVRDLEETRALAVDDSVALLRRVERDLHDGAQVRLVAVAMSLDMIKERLGAPVGGSDGGEGATGPGSAGPHPPIDLDRVRQLVDGAHRNATEALTELRDLARGIHPPVLDDGLPDALATLAARSTVPVELTADVPHRPTPAIETIAYFCAAELLTNVIKHSGASQVVITVTEGVADSGGSTGGVLRLRVADDGRGGAAVGTGSGLIGLTQRVRTVDGSLRVHSPEGGPTAVVVELPLHA